MFSELPGFPSVNLEKTNIEEKLLFPGDTLDLKVDFIISISKRTILSVEIISKAKRAFIRTLTKELEK